jgi:cysteine desulfurase/selenocysteine lyase
MRKLNLVGTTRASFHIYNSIDDINQLISGIEKMKSYFKVAK